MKTQKKKTNWTFIFIITIFMFVGGKIHAFNERGYEAHGGEYLLLLFPLFWWILKDTYYGIKRTIKEVFSDDEY